MGENLNKIKSVSALIKVILFFSLKTYLECDSTRVTGTICKTTYYNIYIYLYMFYDFFL